MSDIKLPPQESPTDTSNWDNRVFNTPVAGSVSKVKKSVQRREMILNAPQSKCQKRPKLKELDIKKSK
ncbi:hypothetical protein A2791_04800 [Candidatus Saccharibacteria bacterium RIFCSPHIGHO2_01_FULL_46_30]|nr:MAG: hypothetical protein A2791_04800 [Candidatus Saccharibacteria bacterium RIFCSPHIGHO2_01_FULL_46_30]